MFQPSDEPPLCDSMSPSPILSPTHDTSTGADAPSAGPSSERSVVHPSLDSVFNFQLVVFQVENTLFQVLRNAFNVPGTIFEAMFALPQTSTDIDGISLEGSHLENPILLPVKADHFRSFLRILYPFIDQTPVVEFDEWVGVLNLATMWSFQEIRAKAINQLSEVITQKSVLERISLAREYRVAEWLRDAYLELAQEMPLKFEELQPTQPHADHSDGNWEADARKWKMTAGTWETLARICYLQTKAAASIIGKQFCITCANYYPCKCYLLTIVDEVFREELEGLEDNPEHVEHPLPSLDTDTPTCKLSGKKKGKEPTRSQIPISLYNSTSSIKLNERSGRSGCSVLLAESG